MGPIQGWFWYHCTHLGTLIILILVWFLYGHWFSLEWGSCKGILNGAIRGLNRACTGQSYGADFGTNELSLLSWSFWYLTHLSMTDGSLLNGAPVQGCNRLNRAIGGLNRGHMRLILVPLNSSHHADHFDTWLNFL